MSFYSHHSLPEIIIIEPNVFQDNRGHFLETYQAKRYLQYGLPPHFVQDNLSSSKRGVLRGLHYQLGKPQGKLIWVIMGEVFDVAVDIRRGAPSFGQWTGVNLSSDNYRQIYIPEGFAHGYCVTSQRAIVAYKCTDYYAPEEERGIHWNDPSLGIDWPISEPLLSIKDRGNPFLHDLFPEQLPSYK